MEENRELGSRKGFREWDRNKGGVVLERFISVVGRYRILSRWLGWDKWDYLSLKI